MRFSKKIYALAALSCSLSSIAWASINFGSRESGFIVSGGTLALGTSPTLTEGSIRNTGGTVTGTTAVCTDVVIETKTSSAVKKMMTDGTTTLGTSISLGNQQRLLVSGGQVAETVTVNGATATPSIIEGFGSFAADITVSDACQLNMRWNDDLNVNIALTPTTSTNTATLQLNQDLSFVAGKSITNSETGSTVGIVDFNGYRILMGGDETTTTSIPNKQTWKNANLCLTGPVSLAPGKTITLSTAGAHFLGNGNSFSFNSSSAIANGGNVVTMENILLKGLTSTSLAGSGVWTLVGTRLEDSTRSVTVDGSITSSTIDIFGGALTFGASRILLNTDVAPGGIWTIGAASTINGSGNVFNFGGSGKKVLLSSSSSLRFQDVTLAELVAASIDASSAQTLYLSDVKLFSDAAVGALHIHGSSQSGTQGAAMLTLATSTTAGNIFASSVTWANGVNMELLSDVTISGSSTWTFSDNTIIDGGGFSMNLAAGSLSIASGKTLTLRNIVLTGVATGSLPDGGGTIDLSNVTVVLGAADVDWSTYNTSLSINGPMTVVTGSYTLTAPNGASDGTGTATINGVTVYYDTLGDVDRTNLVGFVSSGGGRMVCVEQPNTGSIAVTAASDDLGEDECLAPLDGTVAGRTITFSYAGTTVYDGHGRSIIFPYTSASMDTQVVVTVGASTTVTTSNIIFDGMKPGHLSIASGGNLYWGDGSSIRLSTDWTGSDALAQTIKFGTSTSVNGEVMEFDLGGHSIDMSSASALIALQADGTGSTLRIKNGRLLNLSGTKLSATAGSTIILENVELALSVASTNYTFASAALQIEGNCLISGLQGNSFINTSTNNLTITKNGRLTLLDGITYYHNNSGTTNFVMTDNSSRLELMGATFKGYNTGSTPIVLALGTLVIDHKSYIQPNSAGINIGDGLSAANDLTIEVRPGATIGVTTGTLTYANYGG
ncbi:MAG: hypothetical protein QG632_376 [Candidatus Dependentiae bacterium]|nr:hypothetical protein [Candidatus Dependentiae bacterium]